MALNVLAETKVSLNNTYLKTLSLSLSLSLMHFLHEHTHTVSFMHAFTPRDENLFNMRSCILCAVHQTVKRLPSSQSTETHTNPVKEYVCIWGITLMIIFYWGMILCLWLFCSGFINAVLCCFSAVLCCFRCCSMVFQVLLDGVSGAVGWCLRCC